MGFITNKRQDFPILNQKIYGKPLIYLDNAATTQKPNSVIKTIEEHYLKYNANIHRGVHFLSENLTRIFEESREVIQSFLNADSSDEIIFTRGTTEAINLVAFSFGEAFIKEGDEIIVSEMEHHSNIVPWQMMCERKGAKLVKWPILPDGSLDMDSFDVIVNNNTRLISISHVSNALGTINPVKEIIAKAHSQSIPVLIDGAQAVQHISVDVQDLDADFYAFSGHKIYGPTGIGVLYGKKKYLELMPPYQGGGEMIKNVSFEKITYNNLPFKFEAGTPNYIAAIGLAEAIRYVQDISLEKIALLEDELLQYATAKLIEIPGLKMIGTAVNKSSVMSFVVEGAHYADIGMLLDKLGIAVRTGTHCAEPVMNYFNINGTTRASIAFYNTKEEIDSFVSGLKRVIDMLR